MIEAPDLEVALRLTAKASKACRGKGRGVALPERVSQAYEAIDRIGRESARDGRQKEAQLLSGYPSEPLGAIDDDRLRLIFTC